MNTRNRNEVKEMILVHGAILGLVVFSFVGFVAAEFAGKFA
mgnify:CR=1 FL=1